MRRDFPCFVGNPNQHFCQDEESLRKFVEKNNILNDCYWSHNAMTIDRQSVLLRFIPFDLDNEEDVDLCRRDILRLKKWAKKKNVPIIPVFSAGKGFHGYLEYKPRMVKANHALQRVYQGVQLTAVEEAGIETSDVHVHGDHQRILRIPGTMHKTTGLYCNEVPWSIIKDGLGAIKRYCRAPRPSQASPAPLLTVPEWMAQEGVEPRSGGLGDVEAAPIAEYRGSDALLKNILPRMCIHNGIMRQQVGHAVRFEAALTMAKAGFNPQEITNFFMQAGREYGWFKLDRSVTQDMASQIYRNRNTYELHSCGRLRAEGVCVGKICPKFKEVFGDEPNKRNNPN